MKTRRRSFKSQRDGEHTGKHKRGRGHKGGFERSPARPGFKQPGPRPTRLVVMVQEVGAFYIGRPMNRDLAQLELKLEVPEGMILKAGDFVEGVPVGGRGQVLEVVTKIEENAAATWAAICNHGLQVEYPAKAVEEAEGYPAYVWNAKEGREDWRKVSFVTIDGADARDFDDAVWAEEKRGGGFVARVAIADVAHYVREGGALDDAAIARGNSTYFPDRVLPMLPERLSNDLCSLRPKVDRPVLGVEMQINADGVVTGYEFARACIHSAARLTYEEMEGAKASGKAQGVDVRALFAVHAALDKARIRRGALDLDIPEVKIEMGADGKLKGVGLRPRLTSHRLIEELMIAANVAAADALSKKGGGGLYRIHPEPSKEKLETLKGSLGPLGFTVPTMNAGPKGWAKLVSQVAAHPAAQTLMRAILQSQQQAKYNPDNIGHYGLALPLYSHFTSPIRRYADLVVHRALIKALGLKGEGGETWPVQKLARIAEEINLTERRSQMAEWESRDRMVARHFVGLVGKTFEGIVVGIQPFGCFVAVEGVAEGLLPKWLLGDEWAFIGGMNAFRRVRGAKGVLRIGSKVSVELREADVLGGRLTFAPAGAVQTHETPRDFGRRPTRR